MKLPSLVVTSALLTSLSAGAAENVFLNGFTFNPLGSSVATFTDIPTNFITTIAVDGSPPTPPNAGTYRGAGQMIGTLNSNSFVAYCVQISVFVGFGVTYTDYVVQPGAVGFGTRSADLAKLMTWAEGAGLPNNPASSAALQAAVWEIVHETNAGPYSFTAGKLQTTSQSAATQAALGNIESQWSTIMALTPTQNVFRLDGATQDLLIFAPIPEASTWAMMALGLAGVGAAARRRKSA